jgi:flagellar basal-body rod modification protein FlgD
MTQITPPAPAPARPPTLPASQTGPARVGADYQTFLKMLTTQMQNQDPLNPIESSDYAVQLATFSGVEQQVQTNTLLTSLSAQFGVLGMAQLAGWVGQEARTTAPVWMDGAPVTLAPEPAAGSDRAVLVVRDMNGQLVSREDVPATPGEYRWLGGDIAGSPLPAGAYRLELESYRQGTLTATSPVNAYAPIQEARNGPQGAMLVLKGGIEVPAAEVGALRRPAT